MTEKEHILSDEKLIKTLHSKIQKEGVPAVPVPKSRPNLIHASSKQVRAVRGSNG